MKLLDSLNKKLELIEIIESNDGEISELQERELEVIEKEITENALNISWYRNKLKGDIDKAKTMVKAYVDSQQNKLSGLDIYLKRFINVGDKLGTGMGWIAHRSRTTKSIVVINFDDCAMKHKDALIVNTDDNKRIITIDKSVLKTRDPDGTFEIVEKTSEYIDARIKS